jgi:hypothetical protein
MISSTQNSTKLVLSKTPTYDEMDTFFSRPSIAILPLDHPGRMDEIMVKRPTNSSVKASYELCKTLCTSPGSRIRLTTKGTKNLYPSVSSVLSGWNKSSGSVLSGVEAVVDATNEETRRTAPSGTKEAELPIMYVVTLPQIKALEWFAGDAKSWRYSKKQGDLEPRESGSRVIQEYLDCDVEKSLRLHGM